MTTATIEEPLLFNVLETLASMRDIATDQLDETTTILSKEGTPFCLVTENNVYLRSDEEREHIVFRGKRYVKTMISPKQGDDFLLVATEAYWAASERWRNKNIRVYLSMKPSA